MRAILYATGLVLALAVPAGAQGNAQGQMLAGACMGCHGVTGQGASSVPAIHGTKTRAEFVAAMEAFRADQRENTIMGRITRGYTDAEIALLAGHFGQGN